MPDEFDEILDADEAVPDPTEPPEPPHGFQADEVVLDEAAEVPEGIAGRILVPPPASETLRLRREIPDVPAPWAGSDKEDFCRQMIDAWGMDAFLSSQIHKAALQDTVRTTHKRRVQDAYLKAFEAKRRPL